MLLETIGTIALITAFGVGLLSEEASDWIVGKWKAAGITKHDLMKVLHNAYDDTLSSIEFACRERYLLTFIGRPRLYREVSSHFNKEFISPFASEKNLSEDQFNKLTRSSTKYCQIFSTAVDKVLPREEILDTNIEDWLLAGHTLDGTEDIQELNESVESDLIARVRRLKGIPELFFTFLEYKHLLNGSIMFFFCETIKSDERIYNILTHTELQRIREEQSHQYRDYVIRLQAAFQAQLAGFQQCLGPIIDKLSEFVIID